jgi:hypothetical protein
MILTREWLKRVIRIHKNVGPGQLTLALRVSNMTVLLPLRKTLIFLKHPSRDGREA